MNQYCVYCELPMADVRARSGSHDFWISCEILRRLPIFAAFLHQRNFNHLSITRLHIRATNNSTLRQFRSKTCKLVIQSQFDRNRNCLETPGSTFQRPSKMQLNCFLLLLSKSICLRNTLMIPSTARPAQTAPKRF